MFYVSLYDGWHWVLFKRYFMSLCKLFGLFFYFVCSSFIMVIAALLFSELASNILRCSDNWSCDVRISVTSINCFFQVSIYIAQLVDCVFSVDNIHCFAAVILLVARRYKSSEHIRLGDIRFVIWGIRAIRTIFFIISVFAFTPKIHF